AFGNVSVASRGRSEPARAFPDLAEPSRRRQIRRAALRNVVGPDHSKNYCPGCGRTCNGYRGRCGAPWKCGRSSSAAEIVGSTPRYRRGNLDGEDGPGRTFHASGCASYVEPVSLFFPGTQVTCGRTAGSTQLQSGPSSRDRSDSSQRK